MKVKDLFEVFYDACRVQIYDEKNDEFLKKEDNATIMYKDEIEELFPTYLNREIKELFVSARGFLSIDLI